LNSSSLDKSLLKANLKNLQKADHIQSYLSSQKCQLFSFREFFAFQKITKIFLSIPVFAI
jgi:hypothetical protein